MAMNRSKLPKMARWMTTGMVLRVVGADVLQAEPLRHLVIQLNGRALPLAADRVGDVEVDFRPVERPVAFVQRVRLPGVFERRLELCLGRIPRRDLAEELRRTGRRASPRKRRPKSP